MRPSRETLEFLMPYRQGSWKHVWEQKLKRFADHFQFALREQDGCRFHVRQPFATGYITHALMREHDDARDYAFTLSKRLECVVEFHDERGEMTTGVAYCGRWMEGQ